VPLKTQDGTYVVPVLINNAITLNFTVDSGAADVLVPADVVLTLIRTGTVENTDFIGTRLADGSELPSTTFRIRSLKVGDKIVENVTGSVSPAKGPLLLGQSFLSRFKSWSVDNTKHALVLVE
jgi:predicted aspartyl protease